MCTIFALPAPGDQATLQELVGDLMTTPLDRDRPLWHVYVVDGFGEGRRSIVRMHHCIADGIALARVMLSLTDPAPTAGPEPAFDRCARARGTTGSLAGAVATAPVAWPRRGSPPERAIAEVADARRQPRGRDWP